MTEYLEAFAEVLTAVGTGLLFSVDKPLKGSNMAILPPKGSQVALFLGANSDFTEYLYSEHYRTDEPTLPKSETYLVGKKGIPDFVNRLPENGEASPFEVAYRSFMGRTKINKVNSVLDYLQTARAKESDPWHSDEYQVAWQAVYEGFYNKKAEPWQLAYAKFYGASPKKVAHVRAEWKRYMLADTRPLQPISPYRQLPLPFGPFVLDNLEPQKKLPKKVLVFAKKARRA